MAEASKKTDPAPVRVETSPTSHGTGAAHRKGDAGERDDSWRAAAEKRYRELEQELQELREQGIGAGRPDPKRPSWDMSEGERQELEERGVTTDPFVGGTRNALDEGIEPGNEEAQKRAERDKRDRQEDRGGRRESR